MICKLMPNSNLVHKQLAIWPILDHMTINVSQLPWKEKPTILISTVGLMGPAGL